jgi:hypothetical protein
MAGRLEDNFAVTTNFIFYRKCGGGGGIFFQTAVDPGFSKLGINNLKSVWGNII